MKTNENIDYKEELRSDRPDQNFINELIEAFRHSDRMQKRKLFLTYIMLLITGVGFLVVFGLKPTLNDLWEIVLVNLFIVALAAILLNLRRKYVDRNKSDFTLPLLDVLKNTEHNYRFWNSEWLFILSLIIICNLVVTAIFRVIPLSGIWTPLRLTLLSQSIYIPLLGLAFLVEWFSWKKMRKPLREKTLQLIGELENQESKNF